MKKFYLIIATIFIVAACSAPTNNSDMGMSMSMDGEPEGPHTSVEWQIWAYSTAAPEFIAEGAAVYDGPPDMGGKLLSCLLYTSPSPRDLYRSRMPSSA